MANLIIKLNHLKMSQTDIDFKEVLTQFFKKYRRQKLHKVDELAEQFEGKEKEIIMLLCRKYKIDPTKVEGIDLSDKIADLQARKSQLQENSAHGHGEEHHEDDHSATQHSDQESTDDLEEAPKKKKSKLGMIVVLAIILGAGGAFFMFGGMDIINGGNNEENIIISDSTSSNNIVSDTSINDSTLNDSTLNDSTLNDSTLNDSLQETDSTPTSDSVNDLSE